MSRTSLGRLDLSGRGTIVTGAAQGMGEATARLLAERGAHVLVADRNAEGAAHVAEGVGELAVPFAVDVTDPDDCFAMVEAALEHFGRLDAAVNNAGITPEGTYIADTTDEDWRRLISTNLESVFYCMRAELPPMLEAGQGSIVNIGSIMSGAGLEASAAYTAAKHGVLGLTRAAALEYSPCGIRVTCVGPGYMDTPMSQRGAAIPEVRDRMLSFQSIPRLGHAWEVAEMVAFLASDASTFSTGAYYPVDGGYFAR
jgi:NAD(P)-dependent dehydrogenase (short-subunit alcohol dehydrogenase family)